MLHRHTLCLIRPKVSSFIWFPILFDWIFCISRVLRAWNLAKITLLTGYESRNDGNIDKKKEIKVEMHTFRKTDFLKWIWEKRGMQNNHLCADIVFNLSVLGRIACAIHRGCFSMSAGRCSCFVASAGGWLSNGDEAAWVGEHKKNERDTIGGWYLAQSVFGDE